MRYVCLLILLLCNTLCAQVPDFVHYQVENGLSNNAVICTMQDKRGFMWMGTRYGLNRFDGYTFRVFLRTEQAGSLGGNFVISLYEDENGQIYAGTDNGLYIYNPLNEQFRQVNSKNAGEVRTITGDGKGNIWCSWGWRVYRYQPRTGSIEEISGFQNVTAVCIDDQQNVWASSVDGKIAKYDPAAKVFTSYPLKDQSRSTKSTWVEKIIPAGKDSIWVCTTKQGVKLINTRTHTSENFFPAGNDQQEIYARDIVRRGSNEYWIATESGLYIYHPQSGEVVNLKKKYDDPYSISDNAIYCLFRDKEGGMWAGTYFGGINYYAQPYTSFEKFFPKSGTPSLSGNAVREIHPDSHGHLWIGTEDGGLTRFTPATNAFTNFKPVPPPGIGLAYTNLHGLEVMGDSLWIGTFEHGLDVMNLRTEKFVAHYEDGSEQHQLHSNFIHYLLRTKAGKLILCTTQGMYDYDPSINGFNQVKDVPTGMFYITAYEDHEGTIWLGTVRDGLYYYNPHNGKKGKYLHQPDNKLSLSNNRVNGIYEDSRQQLWLATDDGLCMLNRQTGTFTTYGTHNGFLSNMMFSILEDSRQQLWVTTSKGLACFTPATGNVFVYTKAHGLLNDQFNYSSAYKDSSGNMYFGSVKGMIRFNPATFVNNNYQPSIYITGFQVLNKEAAVGDILKKSISLTDTITLAHDQSSFSIDFAALSYTSPEMTAYAYKMEGLDKDWTYLKTNRKAFFTKLSPGHYRFLVKSANSANNWNLQPRELYITILPPFWASYPAYAVYAILLCTIVFLALRWYHQRAEQKQKRQLEILEHEKEKEIYQAKIEFFTHLAHEIRTPLTLIKGPMEKVIRKSEEVPLIQKNLRIMERNTDRLLELTNQLLDFRKTEINGFSLNFVHTDISELLKLNHLRFTPAAEQQHIRFKIELSSLHFFAYVDAEAMNKIIGNLINNAIRYAATRASVHLLPVNAHDNTFTILVKNDGELIPMEMKEKIFEPFFRARSTPDKPGTGIGLSLSRSLTILHKGSLELINGEADMNVFSLTLPVHQDIEFNLSKWKTNH
ncbi:two-component regulator propeller domain-containing protein [Chitinophaga sp. 212800010-3]|uniref:ligand-binding sensor domain-containing protein n=1 Tax=unclassified Chitinophaga TaxID=2619133 RepID=UPI002DE789A2|nr:Signal transduction histidine kinase [Chitinophaga sp. 212800010-3]